MKILKRKQIVVALDFNSFKEANSIVKLLDPEIYRLKIGKQLFAGEGPKIIENFNKQYNRDKYLILGDMLELGKFSKALHKQVAKIINKTSIKKVYVIGNHIKETFHGINRKKRGRILRNKDEIYELIKNDLNNNDHLMIKASNSTGLNKVANNIKKGKVYAL